MTPIDITPPSSASRARRGRGRGPRHAWLVGDVPECLDLARRLDGVGMTTLWTEGTWRPERLVNLLEMHMTLTQVFEAPDLADLRAAEEVIAVNPSLCRQTMTRMVIVTPHLPSLSPAQLAETGIAVFKIDRIAQNEPGGTAVAVSDRMAECAGVQEIRP
jgi:hypothetical protein